MREFDSEALYNQIKSGAHWFYWIAGLSLVNLIIGIAGSDVHFIVGSSFVEFCTGLIKSDSSPGEILGGAGAAFILGFYVYLGRTASTPYKWAFMIGMIIYALDGLLYLIFSDVLPALFHAYVLYRLFTGMKSIDAYLALQQDINNNPLANQEPVAETTVEATPVITAAGDNTGAQV